MLQPYLSSLKIWSKSPNPIYKNQRNSLPRNTKSKKKIAIYINLTNQNKLGMTNSSYQLYTQNHLLHNMQLTIPEKQTTEGLRFPATPSMEENQGRRKSYMVSSSSSSPRLRLRCTCSNHPGSAPCRRHGYMVPRQNMRRYSANKEILRRALTPPNRKMTFRWWNFRPTPSRFSNMSMA